MSEKRLVIKKTSFIKKFDDFLDAIPEDQIVLAEELILELGFMRSLLDDLKKDISRVGATDELKNGNEKVARNQTPEFRAYMDILNRYNQYLKQLLALYPKDMPIETTNELEQFIKLGVV